MTWKKINFEKEEPPKDHMIKVINVYALTSDQVEKDEKAVQELYEAIEKLIETFQNTSASITLIAGYFNTKNGKRLVEEEQHIGQYSKVLGIEVAISYQNSG